MDMEFKSEKNKWEFCAMLHNMIKEAYESKGAIHINDPVILFRLIRILEDVYYPEESK